MSSQRRCFAGMLSPLPLQLSKEKDKPDKDKSLKFKAKKWTIGRVWIEHDDLRRLVVNWIQGRSQQRQVVVPKVV